MLSPGKWHKLIPKERDANVEFRRQVLEKCAVDPEFRAGIMEICRLDIIFWIDVFVWQFNPKKKGDESNLAVGPFICWECQEDILVDRPETTGQFGILWCYENDRTAVVQKSREMGASWLFIIFQVWLGCFHENVQALDISRNEKMVDSKSPDSLFWKIRFIHKWLPEWMKGPIVDNELFFKYEKTDSYITGEPSTAAAGVGGRGSVAFIDEFPRIKEDVAVRQGTASTADSRFFNGTHQGTGTEFYNLTITPEIVQIFLHWSQHPEKRRGAYRYDPVSDTIEKLDPDYPYPDDFVFNRSGKPIGGPHPGLRSPWYDKKCGEIGSDTGVAQELDINPTGTVAQFFSDVLIKKLILETASNHVWQGDLVKDGDGYRMVELPDADDKDAPFKLWVLPDVMNRLPAAVYKVGCDLSYGTGRTNSCVTILNADTGERIGEYVSPNIYPDMLAPMVVWLCRQLVDYEGTEAELIWEMTGPGIRFGIEVLGLGFRKIFWNDNSMGTFDLSQKKRPGWNPETKSKNLLLDEYRSALRNNDFLNRSELALKECLLFQHSADGKKVYHTGSMNEQDPSGAGDNHGDRTIADALTWKLSKEYTRQIRERKKEEGPPMYSYAWRREWGKKHGRKKERTGIYD